MSGIPDSTRAAQSARTSEDEHRAVLEALIPERHGDDPFAGAGAGVWILVAIMLIGIIMLALV